MKRGTLSKDDLFMQVWKGKSNKEQLLDILARFELLMLKLDEPGTLIVPSMLPAEVPTVFSQ